MTLVRRLLSPVGFALVGLCFLLPFVVLRADSEESRYELAWRGAVLAVGGRAVAPMRPA